MANDNSFDVNQVKEYQAILQNIEGILSEIITKDQALVGTASAKKEKIAEELANFKALLQVRIEEAAASGKALAAEEKRNIILQQYRQGLQDQLAKITTSHYQNERALRTAESELKRVVNQLNTLGAKTEANANQFDVLTRKQVTAHQEVLRLQEQQIKYDETERQAIVQKITAEMQYTDAKLKTSQHAQSAMTMLFGLDNKWRQTLAGSLAEMTAAATKAHGIVNGVASVASNLVQTLGNVASTANVAGSSFMKIQEVTTVMVNTIDKSDVALRSATGAGKDFGESMVAAFEDHDIRAMGASMATVQQSMSALYSITREYSGLLGTSLKREMETTAIAANRFGISFNDTALVFDRSARIFGTTGPSMMNRLYNSAVSIGETPVRAVQNFIKVMDTLAQYTGPRVMQVFQGLQALSKQTGVAMQQLVGIANRFDTFEDAASSVAKLNAILGGAYFNSIQMLNASEEKRLHLLRSGLDATDRSWESLGRFEKKALAAAAGIKDMSIAGAFFTGDMAKVREMTERQAAMADTQHKLVNAGMQVVSIMEKIKRIFEDAGFAAKHILGPIRFVVSIMETLGFKGMIAAKLIYSFASSLTAAKVQAAALSAVMPGATAGVSAMSVALRGVAPLLIAAGLAWAFFGDKMREEKSPAAYALPGIIAQGIGGMASSARKAAPEITALANQINSLSDRRVVDLTRAMQAASQLSAPNMNFRQASLGVSELTSAINMLDEKKVNAFSGALGRLGATMRSIPKEVVVAVTQLTKESRAISDMPMAAASRTAAQAASTSAAVRNARASEAPRGGGQGGGQRGVLVTDSISVNVGGTILERKIEDVSRGIFDRMARNR